MRNLCACFILIICLIPKENFSQTISPVFFGQNAWMPDSIGSRVYNGQLHKKWKDIATSGAGVVRFGGIGPDKNKPTSYQYIKMIDSIRTRGMEPIIQVPYNKNIYSSSQAADIVKYINITKGRKIKYWVIGNEPDLVYGYSTSAQIATYIKSFSSAMKKVDPAIIIIGPEVAWYNSAIINGLTSPGGPDDITGKDSNGRYYLDIITFHSYPFNGTQTRAGVITKLTASGSFEDDLTALNARVANCNSYHGRSGTAALKTAVTEANINYQNPASDLASGVGASSFIGGQFWAEMMSIGMKKGLEFINFWSVIEGSNIGYLGYNDLKKPTFYHFKMLAENFSGTYCDGTDNQSNVKAFGSTNGKQVSVMIMNQSQSSDYHYTVRLNKNAVSGTNSLKININAHVDKEYSDLLPSESTTLLIFDAFGNITKKVEYKIERAIANLPPTSISIDPKPFIATISPSDSVTICPGKSVVLKTNEEGFYQWKKDGTAISDATSSSYTAATDGGYTVTITNSDGRTATSLPSFITVNHVLSDVVASGPTTLCTGSHVVLNCSEETGNTYQWKKDSAAITGATTSSYTASAEGKYTVEVTRSGCTATSAATSVIVNDPFASISTSEPLTFMLGSSVTLHAKTGVDYMYQWKKNNVTITGANSSTYKATTVGDYQIKISLGSCNDWSAPVTVTEIPLKATITPAGSLSILSGGSVILNANTGTNYIYQWKKNGVNITGATFSSYLATSPGDYQIKIIYGSFVDWSAPVRVYTNNIVLTTKTDDISIDSVAAQKYFNVKISPNPSPDFFGINITGSSLEDIYVKVYDILGHLYIDQKIPGTDQVIRVGNELVPGYYIAEVRQGMEKKTIKLIKSE